MSARRKSVRRVRRVSSRPASSRTSLLDKTIFMLAAALIVAIGGYLFLSGRAAPAPPLAKIATVALDAQNESGEAGTATLREVDGKVVVTLDLTGAPKGVAQPAYIHTDSCPNLGTVTYPLTSPVDGKSETTLEVSFDELMRKLPLAVNVYKSVAQSKTYVACGDINFSY